MKDRNIFAALEYAAMMRLALLTFGIEVDNSGMCKNLKSITAYSEETSLHFVLAELRSSDCAFDIRVLIGNNCYTHRVWVWSQWDTYDVIRQLLNFIRGLHMAYEIPYDIETLITMFQLTRLGCLV